MAITYPRTDIQSAFGNVRQTSPFQLVSRQEYSRQTNGIVRGKDFGSALWVASFQTQPLQDSDAVTFEAMLNSLDGVVQVFELGDQRRPYPLAHTDGVFSDSGFLNTVNANNKALSLKSLPAGFVLSVGDYLQFDYGGARALHQVMETVTADGTGLTSEFEVRPFIRPGYTVNVPVTLKNPKAQFTLLPSSASSSILPPSLVTSGLNNETLWEISFKAIQYL